MVLSIHVLSPSGYAPTGNGRPSYSSAWEAKFVVASRWMVRPLGDRHTDPQRVQPRLQKQNIHKDRHAARVRCTAHPSLNSFYPESGAQHSSIAKDGVNQIYGFHIER